RFGRSSGGRRLRLGYLRTHAEVLPRWAADGRCFGALCKPATPRAPTSRYCPVTGGRHVRRLRVAITAPDVISSGFSGMGLRAFGIAQGLGEHHDVAVLVADKPPYVPTANVHLAIGPNAHRRALDSADV